MMISRCFHSLYFVSLLLSAMVLIACGEDSETVRVTDRYTLDMLGNGVSLTEETCDSARLGQLLYVGDSTGIFYCTGKAWKKVNGNDGKDGRDGKNGSDGVDGKKGVNGNSGTECYIDKFADAFTIGCGATKAVVRYNFEIPDTCRIELKNDLSYELICGEDSAKLERGSQGDAGDICRQMDIGGGQVRLVCGNDSVTTYKAQCGETPFDPDGTLFCYGDTLVERCNAHAYDIKKQFCYEDSLVDMCGGKTYDLAQQFCFSDSLVGLCGGELYDPKVFFCSSDSIVTLCGGESFDVGEQFCYGDTIVATCDGKGYDLAQQFCYNDSLVDLCDGRDYDLTKQFCYGDSLVDLCGGMDYDLSSELCQNNHIAPRFCGSKEYDESLQFCYNDSLVDLCGGNAYDVKWQFCYDNVIFELCGGKSYKPYVYFCKNEELFGKCGDLHYSVDREFCFAGNVYDLCGREEVYNPEEFICKDGSILLGLCGDIEYEPSDSTCYNGEVVPKCPSELGEKEFCDERNGRVYKYTVIAGQDWMAENLDYRIPVSKIPEFENMSHSFCDERSKDYDLYCGPKGRYYPWHVAMAADVRVCGEGHSCTSSTSQQRVQGVCPDGWHLPSRIEWQGLIDVMGLERNQYWHESINDIKYGYGTNPYGFSAIHTGSLLYKTDKDGKLVEWPTEYTSSPHSASYWSSSESWEGAPFPAKSYVYVLFLHSDTTSASEALREPFVQFRPITKQKARTVRCVRD